jgi:polar amino acid transport system permease protein
MRYEFKFADFWDNKIFLIQGVGMTLWITAIALAIGLFLGLIAGLCKMSKNKAFSSPATIYVELFRNTPELVQLIWVYYCLPILFGLQMVALTSCIIALGLNAGGYLAEVFRAGIQAVDKGQIEAARALGLSHFQTLGKITLPQAIRTMLPPFVNQSIALLKNSSLVSVLGVADLTFRAQVIATNTFRPIEIFTATAIIYFMLCTMLSYAARISEERLTAYRN